jgi:hypothetical protein
MQYRAIYVVNEVDLLTPCMALNVSELGMT